MSDDIIIYAGDQGEAYRMATDEIGGKHHQRVKVGVGPDNQSDDLVGESTLADGAAAASVGLLANSRGLLFNPVTSTWDRARGARTDQGGLTVGVAAVSPQVRHSDGQFRAVEAGNADGQNVAYIPSSGAYIFNGVGWDRLKYAAAVDGTTGTGIAASGVIGYDHSGFWRLARMASQDGHSPVHMLGA